MLGHEFDGQGVTLDSPYGGTVSVAIGKLTIEEGTTAVDAVGFKILDANGENVTEFCLRAVTFATLLEAMMQVFHSIQPGTIKP